ncbi:hypothetical protein [Halorubrum sp. SD626R]|jgi:hypothetical protein|uniref:DUF7854 family protein n=1 Tax=Halorubrum sp. SD626R TaxID=1419722 RepID=UPI000A51F4D8|nr:hypothetical protein [Halorubrum sp. SD626R]
MDRISAIRNVEDALRAFENGEADLADTERRVAAVLRTYATEFDGDGDVFRAVGDEPVDGRVVVAPSAPAARERVLALSEVDVSDVEETDSLRYVISDENDAVPDFEVERVSESE